MPSAFERFDGATVQVSVGEYFQTPPDLVVSLEFFEPGDWDLDACLRGLEPLVTVDDILMDGHSLDVRLANTSWGFDASAVTVALYVANWLIEKTVEGAIEWGLVSVMAGIARRLNPGNAEAISREDATEVAQGRVLAAYAFEEHSGLRVTGERELRDPVGWEIDLASTSGSDYTVAVCGVKGSRVRQTTVSRRTRA